MGAPWQPSGGATGGFEGDMTSGRCGTQRASMASNPLLAKTELGQIKKCMFSNPSDKHVFGYTPTKDPEGAREVTMIWKEHNPSPAVVKGQTGTTPLPDFKTMNKLAAMSGLTTAKEMPYFRATNMVTVKPFSATKTSSTRLPSDAQPKHTYGMASAHRSAEVVRACGPEEPPVKWLVQGAYQDEWVRDNVEKEATAEGRPYIPPVPTRAVLGHSFGAAKHLAPHDDTPAWKMSKFTKVPAVVTQYMTRDGPTMTATQYQQQMAASM